MLTHAELHCDVWLTRRLGCNVYQLSIAALLNATGELTAADLDSHLAQLQNPPAFAYVKVPTEAPRHLKAFLRWGFALVDTNLQFERTGTPPGQPTCDVDVRLAEESDEDEIADLAKRSFEYSRFHADEQIPDDLADQIKARWTRSYFRGERGDAMIVALDRGRIVGFLLALMSVGGTMVVDLVAVDEGMRGRGVSGVMTWFAQAQFPQAVCLRVGTQLANVPAIRCYERLGFQIAHSQYVLHYHNT